MMSEKEITPRTAGSGTGEAPAPQTGSIAVLSEADLERVAGGVTALEYGVLGAVIVAVNGKQIGGVFTASALHAREDA